MSNKTKAGPLIIVGMSGGCIEEVRTNDPALAGVRIVFTETDKEACDPDTLTEIGDHRNYIYTDTAISKDIVSRNYQKLINTALAAYGKVR